MANGGSWSEDEICQLVRAAGEGMSAYDLASQLNRTPDAVTTKARKLGVHVTLKKRL